MPPIQKDARWRVRLAAAALAAALAAVVGFVATLLVDHWQWAFAAAFVTGVTAIATLQFISPASLLAGAAGTEATSPTTVTVMWERGTGSNSGVSGGDVNAPRRSPTAGSRRLAVAATVALVAGGATVGVGWKVDPLPSAHPVVTGATFTARSPFGAPLLDETMEQMRDAITVRAEHAGMEVLDVSIRTPDQLVLRVAGEQTPAAMAELTSLSYLTFRRVIGRTAGGAVTAAHAATPSPSGTRPSPGPLPQLSEVRTQVGEEAWSAAERLSAPAYPGTVPALSPFADLTPEQVAVLPATIQFNVPTITCAQLNRRPPVPQPRLSRPVVACPADVPEKLLLDATEVAEEDLADANAVRDISEQDSSQGWTVVLEFTPTGQRSWTRLTREAVVNAETCALHVRGLSGYCLVAIVLDNVVVTAPEVRAVMTGGAEVGAFTEAEAELLAAQLRYGALPAVLTLTDVHVQRR